MTVHEVFVRKIEIRRGEGMGAVEIVRGNPEVASRLAFVLGEARFVVPLGPHGGRAIPHSVAQVPGVC